MGGVCHEVGGVCQEVGGVFQEVGVVCQEMGNVLLAGWATAEAPLEQCMDRCTPTPLGPVLYWTSSEGSALSWSPPCSSCVAVCESL